MERQHESVNPYATPSVVERFENNSPQATLTRRVRFWVRILGLVWIVVAIALFVALNFVLGRSSEHHTTNYDASYRELQAMQPMMLVVLTLFALGILVLFRVRWGIWAGVAGGTASLLGLASQVMNWQRLDLHFAPYAGLCLAVGLGIVIASGWRVLSLTRSLARNGIPYTWNPSPRGPRFEVNGKPVDGRLAKAYAWRFWQLGWSWLIVGGFLIVSVVPGFMLLPEEYHRPTAREWILVTVTQAIAAGFGVTFGVLGWQIRRRSLRATVSGLVVAYSLLAVSLFSLLLPYEVSPAYRDMASIVPSILAFIAVFLSALSHSALWLRRDMLATNCPLDIQISQLTRIA